MALIFTLVDIFGDGTVTFSVTAVIPESEALFWHGGERSLLLIRQHSDAGLRGPCITAKGGSALSQLTLFTYYYDGNSALFTMAHIPKKSLQLAIALTTLGYKKKGKKSSLLTL